MQKQYKNTNCIFGRNGKIQKNYTNTKCIFLYFICIFLIQKKYEKHTKNTNAIAQKYKIQKNTNQQFQKYKIQKKYEPKILKIQNTKKRQIQK